MSHARNGNAHNFAANFMQAANSCDGAINVEGVFVNHRLHNYGCATANGDIANLYGTSFASDDDTKIFTAIDVCIVCAILCNAFDFWKILRNSRHKTLIYLQLLFAIISLT